MVECHLAKVKVASSNLVSRFGPSPGPQQSLIFYTKNLLSFYTSMNEQPIDSPFMGLALDGFPFTCQKYGSDKVALFIEICHRAGVPPLDAFGLVEVYLPLTEEEFEQQTLMIQRNLQTMLMLDPDLKAEYDKFKETLQKEFQEDF